MIKNNKDIYLKMSALIKASGESKSTILYYVKENLLPTPRKHKANLHLYHKSCVDRLKFIKLLKDRFNFSIDEIKQVMKNTNFNDENFISRFKSILEFEVGNISNELLFENDIILKTGVSPKEMQTLVEEGIIVPINNKYTQNDIELIRIYKKLSEFNLSTNILKAFVDFSKKMAKAEAEFIRELDMVDFPESDKEIILYDMIYKVKKQMLLNYLLEEIS